MGENFKCGSEIVTVCEAEDCNILTNNNVLTHVEYKYRRTSVIVTLDHLDLTSVDIQQIMECGMNVVRFQLSNAPLGDKIRLLKKIEKAAMACCTKYDVVEWPIATCIELRNCLVTTGLLKDTAAEKIFIETDSEIIITNKVEMYKKCDQHLIYVDNPFLSKDIQVGTEIHINGTQIIMNCTKITDENNIKCKITRGGFLKDLSHVCCREVTYSKPLVTDRDIELVKFALEYNVDIITINYTRHADSVKQIKKYIKSLEATPPLIFASICTKQGLENIDEIIKAADGIIFARDFLPYELDSSLFYRLGPIRHWISAKCQQVGKPFFLSGGVLNRTLETGDLFWNEIFEVSNAILEGVTGFCLNACSNTELVLQAINSINDVSRGVEPLTNTKSSLWGIVNEMKMPLNAAEGAALAAVTLANQSNSNVLIATSVSGDTIRMLLKLRPAFILIVVSRKKKITRMLRAYRCTVPLLYTQVHVKLSYHEAVEHRIHYAVEYAVKRGWLAYGEMYVTLARGSEVSSYCDTASVNQCILSKKQHVICPEDGLGKSKNEAAKQKHIPT